LIYIEGLLAFFAVTTSLYIFFYNLFFKRSYTLNRLLALCALITANIFAIFILLNLKLPGLSSVLMARIFLSLITLLATLLFNIMQIYPDIRERRHALVYLMSGIPGHALIVMTLATDLVIQNIPFEAYADRHKGVLYLAYLVLTAFYFAGSVIIVFIKSRFFENRFLRKEVSLFLFGIAAAVGWGILFIIVVPTFLGLEQTRNFGTLVAGLFIILFYNAIVVDIRRVDLQKFYNELFSWLLIGVLLFAPVAAAMKFTIEKIIPDPLNLTLITFGIFVYLFLFFKYLTPAIRGFMSRSYTRLVDDFNEYFKSVKKIDMESDQKTFWSKFYKESITNLVDKYGMLSGHLYILDYQDNSLKPAHHVGKSIGIKQIPEADPLVSCIMTEGGILTTSILYTDSRYRDKRDAILSIFRDNDLEMAIPFFGMDKRLIGILFLGVFPGKKLYSKAFISVLELFRIQFQHQLANGLILDEVKINQVLTHDRLVVDTIKKKIIPREMIQVPGIRVSSFHINNSQQGGDYLDSILLAPDRAAYIMADAAYSGVESGILALELYTSFRTPVRNIDSPDKILNNMNWVISTSRFKKKNAPAFCMTYASQGAVEYSSAAHNPMVAYNPNDGTFSEHATKGIPLGVDRDFLYESRELAAPSGMIGIIYSDGLVSAMNSSGASYGLEPVKRMIKTNPDSPPLVLLRSIYMDLTSFIGDHKQLSDISLILFKV